MRVSQRLSPGLDDEAMGRSFSAVDEMQRRGQPDHLLASRCIDTLSQQTRDELIREDQDMKAGESDLIHQVKKMNGLAQQNGSKKAHLKERQVRCYKKLEDLQLELLHLIGDLEECVTYNPFTGVSTLKGANDGIPAYGSFILSEAEQPQLSTELIELNRGRKLSKLKEGMANLLFNLVYQLEKLRFVDSDCVYPRDFTLRLFGQPPDE